MSTRSRIGYLTEDSGEIRSIYCHFDGYIDGVGANLVAAFNDFEKAKELVEGGDVVSIGNEGKCDRFSDKQPFNQAAPFSHSSKHEFYTAAMRDGEYAYFFDDGMWYVASKRTAGKFVPLESQL